MTRRRPRVFGDFDRDGRYWPNVGKCCVRCQRTVGTGERSERFERKGGGVLTRHTGKCPNPERPWIERERQRQEREAAFRALGNTVTANTERWRRVGDAAERIATEWGTYTITTSSSPQWFVQPTTGRIDRRVTQS